MAYLVMLLSVFILFSNIKASMVYMVNKIPASVDLSIERMKAMKYKIVIPTPP